MRRDPARRPCQAAAALRRAAGRVRRSGLWSGARQARQGAPHGLAAVGEADLGELADGLDRRCRAARRVPGRFSSRRGVAQPAGGGGVGAAAARAAVAAGRGFAAGRGLGLAAAALGLGLAAAAGFGLRAGGAPRARPGPAPALAAGPASGAAGSVAAAAGTRSPRLALRRVGRVWGRLVRTSRSAGLMPSILARSPARDRGSWMGVCAPSTRARPGLNDRQARADVPLRVRTRNQPAERGRT